MCTNVLPQKHIWVLLLGYIKSVLTCVTLEILIAFFKETLIIGTQTILPPSSQAISCVSRGDCTEVRQLTANECKSFIFINKTTKAMHKRHLLKLPRLLLLHDMTSFPTNKECPAWYTTTNICCTKLSRSPFAYIIPFICYSYGNSVHNSLIKILVRLVANICYIWRKKKKQFYIWNFLFNLQFLSLKHW